MSDEEKERRAKILSELTALLRESQRATIGNIEAMIDWGDQKEIRQNKLWLQIKDQQLDPEIYELWHFFKGSNKSRGEMFDRFDLEDRRLEMAIREFANYRFKS